MKRLERFPPPAGLESRYARLVGKRLTNGLSGLNDVKYLYCTYKHYDGAFCKQQRFQPAVDCALGVQSRLIHLMQKDGLTQTRTSKIGKTILWIRAFSFE